MSLAGDTRRRWQNSGAPQAPAVPGVRCAREQGKAALYAPAPPFTHQPPFTRQPLLYLATALLPGDRSFTWRPLLYLATAPFTWRPRVQTSMIRFGSASTPMSATGSASSVITSAS